MTTQLSFSALSLWQQQAFSAAMVERMLPNYQLFSQSFDFGDFTVLRNQLDLVWQKLGPSQLKINIEVQLEKLEENIPDVEDFDSFGVFPALDACMALSALLQSISDREVDGVEHVSQLSINSVGAYVELMLDQSCEDIEKAIAEHPLMQWEIETQQELYWLVMKEPESPKTIKAIKDLVLSEGISNLGIEI